MVPKKMTEEEAERVVREGASKVSERDVEKVLQKQKEIESKFSGGPLGRFVEDMKLLFSLIKDYWQGTYREIPYWTVAAIVATLLYVLNPIDLVPDFIPLVGLVDDATVMAACMMMIRQDLRRYEKWKREND